MRSENVEKMIEDMNKAAKSLRREAQDIVIYTNGSFSIKELYQLPYYQIREILEAYKDKKTKEQEAIDQARGKRSF